MASTRLTRTFTTPTNNKIWTLSFWVKRGSLGASQWVINTDSGNQEDRMHFNPEDRLNYYEQDSGGGTLANFIPTAQLRDTNGWYHVVLSRDSTQATASDRLKMYYNGELQTVFTANTYPSQNSSNRLNTAVEHEIGARNSSSYFDGSMSHIHFIDGTAYDATAFGQYDANGVWTIKTSPSVTYGNNGFFILKDGNSVTDQSGNGNNWTVGGGTLTKTEDNPSNVFATGNSLYYFNGGHTFSNGNNTMYISGGWRSIISTLGTGTGKYYAEAKFVSVHSGSNNAVAGITELNGVVDEDVAQGLHGNYNTGSTYSYHNDGQLYYNSTNAGAWGSTWTAGDIIGIAVDTENNKLYFHKNGTYQASGNPTAGTGGYSIDANKIYGIGCSGYYNTMAMNYGNGYFGTTAVSSAGTNASGNGIFEYDVPTGYTALSTKGLNL